MTEPHVSDTFSCVLVCLLMTCRIMINLLINLNADHSCDQQEGNYLFQLHEALIKILYEVYISAHQ